LLPVQRVWRPLETQASDDLRADGEGCSGDESNIVRGTQRVTVTFYPTRAALMRSLFVSNTPSKTDRRNNASDIVGRAEVHTRAGECNVMEQEVGSSVCGGVLPLTTTCDSGKLMSVRRRSTIDHRSTADDGELLPDPPPPPHVPLYCPVCQSPRIKRMGQLDASTLACLCEACNAEFAVSPQRELRRR
jgi:hypothetical protein